MATQKPISTISYNSEGFLKEKLDSWVDAHIIQAYQYIKHMGEDGDKDHIHVRVEPNKTIDPMNLTDELKEYVKDNPKPLGCRPWRPSKEEDWYLYAVHQPTYLKMKYGGGEKGEKLPYEYTQIVVSDCYDLEVAFIRAMAYMEHSTGNIAKRLQNGDSPLSMLLTGENPYIVSNVVRLLNMTDYERVLHESEHAKGIIARLGLALHDAHLFVHVRDDGSFYIDSVKPDEKEQAAF